MENENLHVHQFRETVVQATCREPGYTLYTCDCGYTHKANFQPAGAHVFREESVTPATCTEPGSVTQVCAACGYTQSQPIAPRGHDYDHWVVQAYPACTTPGVRVRKCRSCAAVEEGQLPPCGHKPAPGTTRAIDKETVEYFCQNCGQTVCHKQPAAQAPVKTGLARVLLIIAAVATLLGLILDVVYSRLGYIFFSSPVLVYIDPFVTVFCYGLLLFNVYKIKANPRYSKVLAVAMLVLFVWYAISLTANVVEASWYYGFSFADIISMYFGSFVNILVYGFLMAVFFTGAKKRTWLFIAVLCHAGLAAIGAVCALLVKNQAWMYFFLNFVAYLETSCFWFALAVLIAPVKAPAREPELLID